MNKIGTYRESSLHRVLKFHYSGAGKTEVSIEGYVCDGESDSGELIEIQTGSFGPLREKIKNLSQKQKIRIVHPVILNKYIEIYDTEGKLLRKRKSTRRGSVWDLFKVLLYAPDLILAPRVTLELALLDIVEKRRDDGKGSWRRKGITIDDRVPMAWHESLVLKKKGDYGFFVPFAKNETFTVKELKEKAGITQGLARKCLYTLHKAGIILRTGKQGNAFVYKKGGRSTRRLYSGQS